MALTAGLGGSAQAQPAGAEGVAEVEIVPKEEKGKSAEEPETLVFSEHLACMHCGLSFEELAPRNFSFNSPYGACERCDGLGTRFEVDPELVISDVEYKFWTDPAVIDAVWRLCTAAACSSCLRSLATSGKLKRFGQATLNIRRLAVGLAFRLSSRM